MTAVLKFAPRGEKKEEREKGIKNNNGTWAYRAVAPIAGARVVTCSTDKLAEANAMARMWVKIRKDQRDNHHFLEEVVNGELKLLTLWEAFEAGKLGKLDKARDEKKATLSDPELAPLVDVWLADVMKRPKQKGKKTMPRYCNQVRVLLGSKKVFRASDWTSDAMIDLLSDLEDEKTGEPISGSTQRRYAVAWMKFYKWCYLTKKIDFVNTPFDRHEEWWPENNPPRRPRWDFIDAKAVLKKMSGPAKVAMTLILGTGMEKSAVLKMKGRDVMRDRQVRALGTKNNFRDRVVFCDKWAWKTVLEYAMTKTADELLFDMSDKLLREAFYKAQVEAQLITEPPRTKSGGENPTTRQLWSKVDGLHRIHDCRHTYCKIRLFGLDGEDPSTERYCMRQLGHGSTQMVSQVYGGGDLAGVIAEREKERKSNRRSA